MAHPTHDLIISAVEINHHHGVGILLQRLFPDSTNLVTLRSATLYRGDEAFGIGHHELKSATLTPPETEARLKEILAPYRIRRILCVPYHREDFVHGLLAQKLTKAPLCTYIMDDQNIYSTKVPDHWVQDLLRRSDLCFGISPELCAVYQHKYGREFHLLPPLVERAEPLIPCYWQPDPHTPVKVAMIGNVWTAARFQQLRALLREANLHVDWYGNGSAASWLAGTPEEWEEDNIRCLGYLPEEDLVASLAAYPCILIPSGSLDHDDDNLSFSRLSLPSRLVFLHTRTDTPVLLLGSENSAAGRFILSLGSGLCAAYHVDDLRRQLTQLHDESKHLEFRQAIRRWAPHLVLPDGGQWLWESLARKSPLPANFDAAFQRKPDEAAWLKDIPVAKLKASHVVPSAKDPISDEEMKSFAFLRTTHLELLQADGAPLLAPADLEVTQLLERLTGYLVGKMLPRGGDILILSAYIPSWATRLPPKIRGWRIRDLDQWRDAAFPNETGLVSTIEGEIHPLPAMEFDAIISMNWLDQVQASEALAGLAQFLTRRTKAGGLNLHATPAVLHPEYFWTAPAYAYLRTQWDLHDWPGLDDIVTAPDLFCMSEEAYAKYWEPSSGRPYRDCGKPLGLVLFWRKASESP